MKEMTKEALINLVVRAVAQEMRVKPEKIMKPIGQRSLDAQALVIWFLFMKKEMDPMEVADHFHEDKDYVMESVRIVEELKVQAKWANLVSRLEGIINQFIEVVYAA